MVVFRLWALARVLVLLELVWAWEEAWLGFVVVEIPESIGGLFFVEESEVDDDVLVLAMEDAARQVLPEGDLL